LKTILYIFTAYILVLSSVPCCSFDDCPDDKQENTSPHDAGDDDCGTCSPFFNCEGCATAVIGFGNMLVSIETDDKKIYSTFSTPGLSHQHIEFWQPPKLG
jgi:hypothetical protein